MRQLASITGTLTDSLTYDSFGNTVIATGSTTNYFRFLGMIGYYFNIDQLNYLLRRRFYDTASGRFLSRDPLLLTFDESDVFVNGLNPYSYVQNDPVRLVDP